MPNLCNILTFMPNVGEIPGCSLAPNKVKGITFYSETSPMSQEVNVWFFWKNDDGDVFEVISMDQKKVTGRCVKTKNKNLIGQEQTINLIL